MTFKEIQEIIKLVTKSDLTEFKLRDKDFELSIKTKNYSKGDKVIAQAPMVSVAPAVAAPAPAPVAAAAAAPATPAAEEAPVSAGNVLEIKSPIIGTFYRAPGEDKPPFIKVGDKVKKGDIVCIVEAMKLFNEIESEVSGTVVKILIDDAQPVEYDTPLFLVEP